MAEKPFEERPFRLLAPCEGGFGTLLGGVALGQRAERFACDLAGEIGVRDAGVFGFEVGDDAAVFGFVLRPGGEFLLIGAFRGHGAQAADAQRLALPFLPCVGDRGVFGGVMDAQRRVALLCRGDDVEASVFLIVLIIGGIISGFFTPTEASCVAVVYAAIIAGFSRTLPLSKIPGMLLDTAKTTGLIVFLIGVSAILGWVLAYAKLPNMIAQALLNFSDSSSVILLGMMVIMLVVGCVMDPAPAVLIFTPIFLPVAMKLGISPVHFGVMMVFNLSLGAITPPVGPILFTGCRIARMSIDDVFLKMLPFFGALIVTLVLVTLIPSLSMALPTWAGLVH